MMHHVPLIATLSAALGLALVFGFLACRLKLPALLGYLVAGVLIGPFTPGYVADAKLAAELAEIGVMLLMFGVGLHFSLDDLLQVRRIALPGAIVQMAAATVMGLGLAVVMGWGWGAGLVFGLCLSVASTVVLLRALEGKGLLQSKQGQIAIGWLVVEDLAMVLVLVLLPPMAAILGGENPAPTAASQAAGESGVLWTLGLTLLKVSAFIAFMVILGRKLFPALLWQITRTGSRELFTLCVIAAAVSFAYGAALLFGVSFALGAFFAGMMMRESAYSHRAAEESLPLRESFSVLFFVSVGMLFNPAVLVESPLEVLAVVGIIVVGKSIAAALLTRALGYSNQIAFTVSASLAQIGEFSFILAGLGVALNVMPEKGQHLVLAGAIISIAINPMVFYAAERMQQALQKRALAKGVLPTQADELEELPMNTPQSRLHNHLVVVGYGHVGVQLGEKLKQQGMPFVVIEAERDIVQNLRAQGIEAVLGDALNPVTLVQAHLHQARAAILSISDAFDVQALKQAILGVNPKIQVLAAAKHAEDAQQWAQESHMTVVCADEALANALCRAVMDNNTNAHNSPHA